MIPDLRPTGDSRDARIAALQAPLAGVQAQHAARAARITDWEAQLAAAQRAGKRQATPIARRARKADPQKPGRKQEHGRFASRAQPGREQITATKTALLAHCPQCARPLADGRTSRACCIGRNWTPRTIGPNERCARR